MQLLLLTERQGEPTEVAPSLAFLDHELTSARLTGDFDPAAHRGVELVLVDATANLGAAATACRTVAGRAEGLPVLVVVGDAALAALKASWGFDDWLLPSAQPAEIETRMRLARERSAIDQPSREASVGDLSIDEDTYIVRLRGRPLDLTFREFELLKYLAANPGRVFTRGQLLQEVWGYDYFGGTRTVDVHIRRLRAKLGAEYEQLIGTVRGVGYKLDPQGASTSGRPDERGGPAP
ncbi:MAG: response regulator transcription factor [Egibacteraceae bacterium]